MLDTTTFHRGMKLLERAVPTFKPVPTTKDGPGTYDAFYELLKDLSPDIFYAAILRVSTDEEWVSVRAIRKAAESVSTPQRRSGIEAWGDVISEVKRVGSYGSPKFSDPIVEHVVAALGWTDICLTEDIMPLRAHFLRAYESVSNREHDNARQLPQVRARIEAISGPTKLGDMLKQIASPK